jgi:hypothetical protein
MTNDIDNLAQSLQQTKIAQRNYDDQDRPSDGYGR